MWERENNLTRGRRYIFNKNNKYGYLCVLNLANILGLREKMKKEEKIHKLMSKFELKFSSNLLIDFRIFLNSIFFFSLKVNTL
jgi:hypothetical protein